MLQVRITQELHNRDIECTPYGKTAIHVEIQGREVYISLENVIRMISSEAEIESVIQGFVENVMGWIHQSSDSVSIYPRVLPVPDTKPLSYPWTQPFLGTQLEISLVEHSQGRMRFLSPLQILKQNGGLQEAKRRSVANLESLISQVEVYTFEDSIWSIQHPEVLTSSLVLFLDKFTQLRNMKTAQFAIPSRGALYFSSTSLLRIEHQIKIQYSADSYPISPNIFQVSLEHIQQYRQSWMPTSP